MCKRFKQFFLHSLPVVFLFFAPCITYAQEEVPDSVELSTSPTEDIQQDDQLGDQKKYFSTKEATGPFPAIRYRRLPEGAARRMKEDKDFWYADLAPSRGKKKEEDSPLNMNNHVPLGQQPWFQTILWLIIIGGFATCIIIYLGNNNVGLFRRKNLRVFGSATDEMPEDIFAINYPDEIEKARLAGNFRLAVRLHFLRMLKLLSEKQVIRYTQDKTNFDYLLQLQGGKHYDSFFRITRDYEYSWYGQFPVSAEMYQLIRQDFSRMDKELEKH